jgi:hypothetical protein
MSGVFNTITDYSPLDGLVDWIALGSGDESALPGLLEELLPATMPKDANEARLVAWNGNAMARTAAYLWLIDYNGWADSEPDADEFRRLRSWARNYAMLLRLCLIEPAEPDQIADGLALLADVLDQSVSERTATFIIEDLIGKAKLPFYVVNALLEHVAKHEAGKIRPASFTRLVQGAEERLQTVRNKTRDLRLFVNHLEPALDYFREHLMSDEPAVEPAAKVLRPPEFQRERA